MPHRYDQVSGRSVQICWLNQRLTHSLVAVVCPCLWRGRISHFRKQNYVMVFGALSTDECNVKHLATWIACGWCTHKVSQSNTCIQCIGPRNVRWPTNVFLGLGLRSLVAHGTGSLLPFANLVEKERVTVGGLCPGRTWQAGVVAKLPLPNHAYLSMSSLFA